ncbi:hypothetical protein E2C01_020784 [Portunus trituberculatus]|uniref:Uncharacterized protein n=1 Tax=Portunus trituberculatus TaxID=210409 RepID=A0A5B7E0V1_PORTR|nr:hypothetical protein [Portunus trituberculatus]
MTTLHGDERHGKRRRNQRPLSLGPVRDQSVGSQVVRSGAPQGDKQCHATRTICKHGHIRNLYANAAKSSFIRSFIQPERLAIT